MFNAERKGVVRQAGGKEGEIGRKGSDSRGRGRG